MPAALSARDDGFLAVLSDFEMQDELRHVREGLHIVGLEGADDGEVRRRRIADHQLAAVVAVEFAGGAGERGVVGRSARRGASPAAGRGLLRSFA